MRFFKIGLIVCGSLLLFSSAPREIRAQNAGWITISSPREEIDFEIPSKSLNSIPAKDPEKLDINRFFSKQAESGFDVQTASSLKISIFGVYLDFSTPFDKECSQGELAGFQTFQCTFSEPGYFHAFRIIVTNHRIYSLYAYGKGAMSDGATRFLESPVLAREPNGPPVISSFEVENMWNRFSGSEIGIKNSDLATMPEIVTSTRDSDKSATDRNENRKPTDSGLSPDEGLGPGPGPANQGSGSGIGPGADSKPEPPKPGDNVPIQLFSKPRPGYTQLARYFAITGSTRLRVTFNADGKIGSVTPITYLPFGLTEQAIKAARGIRFRPEKRRGRTVSVRKRVAYNFTIY